MSRLVKKSPSICTDQPLDNADIRNKLKLLEQLLRSCYGPKARLKHLHNNIGGHVVTTSASSLLLPALSSSQPLIHLIKTSIHNHISRFSDCGLFAAILCLSLIEHAQQSGLRRNRVIIVNKHLLTACITYLQQEDCDCKVKMDFCSTQSLLTLAHSIISSKPACVLTESERFHMSKLAVQAFLLTVPCSSPGTLHFGRTVTVSVEGQCVLKSAVFPGLMVHMPNDFDFSEIHNPSHPLKVVLFSASLAGDLPELVDRVMEVHPGVDTDSQILELLLDVCKQVVKDDVKLFVCQKVIHPVVQHYLRSHGVIVVERLGITLMEPLTTLTGAQPVAMLQSAVTFTSYGQVSDLSIKQFGDKKLLHLQPVGESAISTMVLCHRNETMMSELKVVWQTAEHVLRLALREPSALHGGGCTETHLAAYIRHKSMNEKAELASALRCSQTEFLRGVDVFCRSLESVAKSLEHDGGNSYMDLTYAHHWINPADSTQDCLQSTLGFCGCGLLNSSTSNKWNHLQKEHAEFAPASMCRNNPVQPRVLDSFTAKLNALQVAVETANLALDVRFIIHDVN
ncbi:molecular chaperone MKKS [Gouania willdenowi]|uniref:McKusick-Kaufman syndrome n=1 Tax=Gouania willdenowi TaxID=441366 RepID=A0A8C5EIG3_GOUWI|nr:McKusick-Kaufman/Bardet-Biedl syndromes putative chaperonin [Gouania willdenowi]